MQGCTKKRISEMEKECAICGEKISRLNNGFSDLLDNSEKKKLLNIKGEQTICNDCKFTLMAVSIFSPFKK